MSIKETLQNEPRLGDLIGDIALSYIDSPSQRYTNSLDGMSPSSFDCSGFVLYVLKQTGVDIPEDVRRVSEILDNLGVLVHWELHKKGDLVFFSYDGLLPKHVGIVINESEYVHSPGTDQGKVNIKPLVRTGIKDLRNDAIYNRNPIGFKRLGIKQGRWTMF